jgi:putative hemolysin
VDHGPGFGVLAGLRLQIEPQQMFDRRSWARMDRESSVPTNVEAGAGAETVAPGAVMCGESGEDRSAGQLVEVRECLNCRLQGFNATAEGQTCRECKSSSTRRVAD